jgi:hypothetical protein
MTAGVAITSLYCKGKLSEVGIKVDACCKDVNKGGCCNTQTKIVKMDDNFVNHSFSFEFHNLVDFNFHDFGFSFVSELINTSYFKTNWGNAPPLLKGDLYLLFRSLII